MMVPSDTKPQVLTPLSGALSIEQCIPVQRAQTWRAELRQERRKALRFQSGGPSVEQWQEFPDSMGVMACGGQPDGLMRT